MTEHILNKDDGFTLIETLVAVGVLVTGIMALYMMQISSINGNAGASRLTLATTWGQEQVEDLLVTDLVDIPEAFTRFENGALVFTPGAPMALNPAAKNWNEIIKLDTTDDGSRLTNQDPDKNGIDDSGVDGVANFGLDNTVAPAADFSRQSPDGRFTIYYNFAMNVPLPRVVTIRIIIQENNTGTPPVVLTYTKDHII